MIVTAAAIVTGEDGIPSGQFDRNCGNHKKGGDVMHSQSRVLTVACLEISLLAMMLSRISNSSHGLMGSATAGDRNENVSQATLSQPAWLPPLKQRG